MLRAARRRLTARRAAPTVTLGPLVVHVFRGAGGEMLHPEDRAHPDEWGRAHIPARAGDAATDR